VANVADVLAMHGDNMSSNESEMDEETHWFNLIKQYECLPVKAENYGKQRENSMRVTMIHCLDYQREL
jgi:hypothetical protein